MDDLSQATRAEIETALASACETAKALKPSPAYDSAHRYLSSLLYMWQMAPVEVGAE